MTISTESTRVEYDGDGGTKPFAVPFKFLDKVDLVVLLRDKAAGTDVVQTLTTHYTVTGAGAASGTVTFVTAPPTGQRVVIYNDPDLTQLVDYQSGDTFPAETHEQALDRLTLQQKRTRELVERAPRLLEGDLNDGTGTFDANLNRIKNLGAPVDLTDAATKTYVASEINNAGLSIPTGLIATGSSTSRSLADRWADTINVKDFGAVGNGVADDTVAINAAFTAATSAGGGMVYLPAGTYRIDGQLTPGQNVSIKGDGLGVSILDASAATYRTEFSETAGGILRWPQSTYSALPALTVAVSVNDRTLTFASAPSVSAGDIILINNPTDGSWSGFRTYYRATESVRVASVAGSVVTLQGSTAQAYAIADVDLYVLSNPNTVKLSGFSLKGLADTGHAINGIAFAAGVDCVIENVRSFNSSYVQLYLDGCFNVGINNCICEEDFSVDFGGDYGLTIGASSNVTVSGGYFSSSRHGIAMGSGSTMTLGGADSNGPMCRYNKVMGAHVSTSGSGGVPAADVHGNCEWITYDGCTIDGSIDFGGDHIVIQNCLIRGDVEPTPGDPHAAVYGTEFKGHDMTIQNNMIQHSGLVANRGAMIDIGGNSSPITADTTNGGTIVIHGNTMQWNPPAGQGTETWLRVVNRGYVGAENTGVVITNNTLTVVNPPGDYGKTTGQMHGNALVRQISGDPWDFVTYNNNATYGAGGLYTTSTGNSAVLRVDCKNNSADWSGYYGYNILGVRDSIIFTGNTASRCNLGGVILGGTAAVKCAEVVVTGNALAHNFVAATGSSTSNADIVPSNITRLSMDNNFTGSDAVSLTVADNTGFVLGEVITGGSSGATGTVTGTRSTTTIYIHETIQSGPFDTAGTETITGTDSGATTTVSNQFDSQSYSVSGLSVDEAWRSNNIDYNGRRQYLTGITTDHGGTITLGSGDATPSVSGGKTFITAGGSAITDFDDGIDGQTITVRAHGAITLTDSANLQLDGNADFDMALDDTVTLANIGGTNWYETGRTVSAQTVFTGSATWNPVNVPSFMVRSVSVSCPGATVGMFVKCSLSSLDDGANQFTVHISGFVESGGGSVRVSLTNMKSGTVTVPSGTVKVSASAT